MIISKEQAQELIKYFNNQFIDRNSTKLYDGEILNELLKELNHYLTDMCGDRHTDGYSICRMPKHVSPDHMDNKTNKTWRSR